MKKTARLPWLTLGAGAVTLALGFSPAWSAAQQLDRAAIELQHAYWRLLGAHFTHWSPAHLACELAAFLACGWFVEQVSRTRMIGTTVVSALAVSLAVLVFAPEIETYRGLSGIVSALFAAAAVELMRRAAVARSRLAGVLATAAVAGLIGKTIVELVVAHAPFVGGSGESAPVPVAHLAGIAVGLCIALLPHFTPRTRGGIAGSSS